MSAEHDSHVTAWRDTRHEQARRFLQRLDPEAEAFTFQTFDDTKEKRKALARIVHGDLTRAVGALEKLQQQRAGVFVTINATDGTGRQAHNIKRVRALFADLDGAPLAPVLAAQVEPHIVCESSPGRFHAYWLTDDCPLDQFEIAQRALARRFNGDVSVHDLPRVMRLPGFRHFKGDAQTCKILEGIGANAPAYPLARIVDGLQLKLDAAEPTPARTNGDGGKIATGDRHAHLFASARSMALRLSRDAVRAALAIENQSRCDPPVPDADIDYLAARAFDAKDSQGWKPVSTAAEFSDVNAPAPLDIFRDFVAAPYSPDDVPERVARFARAFSSSTGFDRSAALVAAVGAAAAAIDDRYRLAVRPGAGWFESARLWIAIIGSPSAGKSPSTRAATDPIKHLHMEAWERWQAEERNRKNEEAEGEGEPEPSLFTSDCTLEALSDVLKANPRGILMLTEEFASWIGSIDAYRNGQGSRDRGEMLQLYDGGPHQIHRVKRGSFLVPNWGASVIAAGTPAGLRQQIKQLPDDGLIHRFIPCIMRRPEPLSAASIKEPLEDWERVLRRLFRDSYTPETQQRAQLTPAAAAVFEEEAARIREAVADVETVAPALASHLGKHPGMIARVALTFHLLIGEGGESGEVAPSTVEMACRFLRTARKHAVTLFTDILQASPVRELARSVGRSIAAADDAPAHVSRAWLSSHCRQFRDAPDYQRRAAIEFLEDANWISPAPGSRTYGAWSISSWALNPGIWERFSDVGAEHTRRRASVRDALLGAD